MSAIFIGGVPACLKTTIGNQLRDHYGFAHVDMEADGYALVNEARRDLDTFLNNHPLVDENTVMTWGFVPEPWGDIPRVKKILDTGYKFVWLEGDAPTARKHFIQRFRDKNASADHAAVCDALYPFELQIIRMIAHHAAIYELHPKRINVFDASGEYRKLDEIVNEILGSF